MEILKAQDLIDFPVRYRPEGWEKPRYSNVAPVWAERTRLA
jgi:hypothetical protein